MGKKVSFFQATLNYFNCKILLCLSDDTAHHTSHVSTLFTNADFPENTMSVQRCIEAGGNSSWKNSKWPLNTYPESQEKAAESAWMMALHNINSSCNTRTILLAGILFPPNKYPLPSSHCNSSDSYCTSSISTMVIEGIIKFLFHFTYINGGEVHTSVGALTFLNKCVGNNHYS